MSEVRPTTLCVFTQHLGTGGIETRMSRVIGGLPRPEFKVHWMGFGQPNPHLVRTAGPDVELTVFERDLNAPRIDGLLIGRIARRMREIRPDIVHVHNWSTSLYAILGARFGGARRVIFESGGREQPEGATRRQISMMRALRPHVDQLTSVSAFLSREMDDNWGVAPGSTRTMPTGIDLARFRGGDRARARQRLGVPEDAVVVGTIGMFRPVKRIEDLLEAGLALMPRHPRLHLVLVGSRHDGEVPADIKARAAAAGMTARVHLPGRLEDSATILPAFDVFVNASVFEGVSNAIIEAMAAALPVVATAVGGNPEVVFDGDDGFLIPPRDPDALARALERLLRDEALRQRLGARARAIAEAEHGIAGMVDAYAQLHRALLSRPDRPWWSSAARTARGLTRGARTYLSGT